MGGPELGAWWWAVMVIGGPILLAIGLIYGTRKSRQRKKNLLVDREQEQRQSRAARQPRKS